MLTLSPVDANGWFQYVLNASDRIIWVSRTDGHINNSGFSATSNPTNIGGAGAAGPVKTLAGAWALRRDGHGDWILLDDRDTWTNEQFGFLDFNGRSAIYPFVIGRYDHNNPFEVNPYTGVGRPTVEASASYIHTNGPFLSANDESGTNAHGHYIAVSGIKFGCYDRDPDDARFDTLTSTANITVTTTSQTVTLPAGSFVSFRNPGTNSQWVRYRLGAGPAISTDPLFGVSTYLTLNITTETQISFKTDSGTAVIKGYGGAPYTDPNAVVFQNGSDWFLFEDCYFHHFNDALELHPFGATGFTWKHQAPFIHRNILVDNYGASCNALFLVGVQEGYVCGNFVDRNGYCDGVPGHTRADHSTDGGGTNHGLYFPVTVGGSSYYMSGPLTVQNNIVSRDIRGFSHFRCGGNMDRNVTFDCTAVCDFGRTTPGYDNTLDENLFSEEIDIVTPDAGFNGSGVRLDDTQGDGLDYNAGNFSSNETMWVNGYYTGLSGWAIAFVGDCDATLTNAIIHNIAAGWPDHGPIKTNNHTTGTVTITGEKISDVDSHYNNTISATYFDPTRCPSKYAVSMGLSSSGDTTAKKQDDLATALKGQSKLNWNSDYTALAIINYVRVGFNLATIGGSSRLHHLLALRLRLRA